jgi:hypothetical protein
VSLQCQTRPDIRAKQTCYTDKRGPGDQLIRCLCQHQGCHYVPQSRLRLSRTSLTSASISSVLDLYYVCLNLVYVCLGSLLRLPQSRLRLSRISFTSASDLFYVCLWIYFVSRVCLRSLFCVFDTSLCCCLCWPRACPGVGAILAAFLAFFFIVLYCIVLYFCLVYFFF